MFFFLKKMKKKFLKFFSSFVVSQILSGETKEQILDNIHSKLMEVGENVEEGKIPVELYCITKVRSRLR